MNISELNIPGCYLICLPNFKDKRGSFIKTFHPEHFSGTPFSHFDLKEEFYSVSKKNVLRGLHFQAPPFSHNKLITCLDGKVLDFFVDLRKSSSCYGKLISIELDSAVPQMLCLPKGIAHGFLTLSNQATLLYKTDCIYSPEHDSGILWSSVGLDLKENDFIISDRDKSFSSLANYESPFV